jgi:hypothetical protein
VSHPERAAMWAQIVTLIAIWTWNAVFVGYIIGRETTLREAARYYQDCLSRRVLP